MKKITLLALTVSLMWNLEVQAQRYVNDTFTDAQIQIDKGVTYATNVNFLISNLAGSKVPSDIVALKTAVGTGQPIPAAYFNPADTSTHLKVSDLKMDLYYPMSANDPTMQRPVFISLNTGNFLPPCTNGAPTGTRGDSANVALCMSMARKGYVAISMSYRQGWNPISTVVDVRTGTLLNAVYRAIHDVKMCVRGLKKEAAGANKYRIDPNKIVLFGEGTGAYISYSVATLNKYSELLLPKFIDSRNSLPYIDTIMVGNLDGFGGNLNLYIPNGFDANTRASIGMGGAMADTTWIDAGENPLMAFKCVRDPYAPFNEGLVTVPGYGYPVVDVPGPNEFIRRANRLGNNNGFLSNNFVDGYSMAARSWYGKTIDYIYPAPENKITINAGLENCYPFVLPLVSGFSNQAAPWQWWDPTGPTSTCIVNPGPPPVTAHQAALDGNPGMGVTKAMAYIDTISRYMSPRLACLLDLYCDNVSVKNLSLSSSLKVYPNPATAFTVIQSQKASIQSIKLLDINGRQIVEISDLNTYEYVLEMPSLTKGIYFIQIETNLGFGVKKLLVD